MIRTRLPESALDGPGTGRADTRWSSGERAFRRRKTGDLKGRPVSHRTEPRVRAHVLLGMLAYYIEWHMRQRLKPLRCDDEEAAGAEARRPSVGAPGSPRARAKVAPQRTPEGDPGHSLRTLIGALAPITRTTVAPRSAATADGAAWAIHPHHRGAPLAGADPFPVTTRPTPLQRTACKLLGVKP